MVGWYIPVGVGVGTIRETLGFLCFFVLRVTGLRSRHAIFLLDMSRLFFTFKSQPRCSLRSLVLYTKLAINDTMPDMHKLQTESVSRLSMKLHVLLPYVNG